MVSISSDIVPSATPGDRSIRAAVDIGGTFTDVVLERGTERWTAKVLTTPASPDEGFLAGLDMVLSRAGLSASELDLIVHGTTLATNALIERRGARTALLTTDGFRDTIEIGTESRFEQYDLMMDKPEPLVPRHLRFGIRERRGPEGSVLLPFAPGEVEALVPELRRRAVESVAIGFLHSYVDPGHERAAREVLRQHLPEVDVSISSDVAPEMREYERISTTCADAYVKPLIRRYLARLETALAERGARTPLFLMLSGGGISTVAAAASYPIRLVESGPAGGAIFAAETARRHGIAQALSFDMGGTTAKICLVDDGEPQIARSFEVARVYRFLKGSGLPLRIPVIEMVEIGTGGGSLARIDGLGHLVVGPQSAGSVPGPACYGRGGTGATVTDADLVLGRIDGERFSGGSMPLDLRAAREAIDAAVGRDLALATEAAAFGISEIAEEAMASAARVHAIESGKGLPGRTLIAFGGAAPLHAARLAEKLGIDRVLIPTNAGVGSAVGFLRAPVAYETVRSDVQRLGELDVGRVNTVLDEMRRDASAIVALGAPGEKQAEQRSAHMRYVGQGHEIAVPMPARALGAEDRAAIRDAFEREYRALYHRPVPGGEIEILNWTVRVTVEQPPEPVPDQRAEPSPAARSGTRRLHTGSGEATVPTYDRAGLLPGAWMAGPAILVEDETATLITDAFDAVVTGDGAILMIRKGQTA